MLLKNGGTHVLPAVLTLFVSNGRHFNGVFEREVPQLPASSTNRHTQMPFGERALFWQTTSQESAIASQRDHAMVEAQQILPRGDEAKIMPEGFFCTRTCGGCERVRHLGGCPNAFDKNCWGFFSESQWGKLSDPQKKKRCHLCNHARLIGEWTLETGVPGNGDPMDEDDTSSSPTSSVVPTAASQTEPSNAGDVWLSFECTTKSGGRRTMPYLWNKDRLPLVRVEVPADGHCLYNALSLGKNNVVDGGKDLRAGLSAWAAVHQGVNPAVSDDYQLDQLPGLADTPDWDTWIHGLQRGVLGSHAEMVLAANALDIHICVFAEHAKDADEPTWIRPTLQFQKGEEQANVYLVNHWSMDGAHKGSEHYDVLLPRGEYEAPPTSPEATILNRGSSILTVPGSQAEHIPVEVAAEHISFDQGKPSLGEPFTVGRREYAGDEADTATVARQKANLDRCNEAGFVPAHLIPRGETVTFNTGHVLGVEATLHLVPVSDHDSHHEAHNLEEPKDAVGAVPCVRGRLVFSVEETTFFWEGYLLKPVAEGAACTPCGPGSLCAGDQAREIFRGEATDDGTPSARSFAFGETIGYPFTELAARYVVHSKLMVRAWSHDATNESPYLEVRFQGGAVDSSWCLPLDDADMDEVPVEGAPQALDPEPGLPTGITVFIGSPDRTRYKWIGPLGTRPESVRGPVFVDERSNLTWHTNWVSALGLYPYYETVQFTRIGPVNKRHRAGYVDRRGLRYGVWDFTRKPYMQGSSSDTDKLFLNDVLCAENVLAVMFGPPPYDPTLRSHTVDEREELTHERGLPLDQLRPLVPPHSICSVFFDVYAGRSPNSGHGGRYEQALHGFPVQMPSGWAEQRFPDHWALALQCPNVPVLLTLQAKLLPPFRWNFTQLWDPRVLKLYADQDQRRRLEPTSANLPTVSLQWSLADHVFGWTGARMQLEWFGLFGLLAREAFPWRDASGSCTKELQPISFGDLSTLPASSAHYRWPDVTAGSQDASQHYKWTELAADHSHVVNVVGGELTNATKVACQPGHGANPFRVDFWTRRTRSCKRANDPFGETGANAGVLTTLSVSWTWMRTYFHPMVCVMALREMWDPVSLVEWLDEEGAPVTDDICGIGITEYASSSYRHAVGPASRVVDPWFHNTPLDLQLVGHTLGEPVAGCARTAMLGLLRHAAGIANRVDDLAEDSIRDWDDWVKFDDLPHKIQELCGVSRIRRYKAVKLLRLRRDSSRGAVSRHGAEDAAGGNGDTQLRVNSSLGRGRLHQAGYRVLLLRPVMAGSGWSGHTYAATSDANGAWTLHNPSADGCAREPLVGVVPGVMFFMQALAVVVVPKGGQGTAGAAEALPAFKRQKTSGSKTNKLILPVVPTPHEAAVHCTTVTVLACLKYILDYILKSVISGPDGAIALPIPVLLMAQEKVTRLKVRVQSDPGEVESKPGPRPFQTEPDRSFDVYSGLPEIAGCVTARDPDASLAALVDEGHGLTSPTHKNHIGYLLTGESSYAVRGSACMFVLTFDNKSCKVGKGSTLLSFEHA